MASKLQFIQSLLLILLLGSANAQEKRILIVSTNRDSVGTNRSGTFLKEIAYPFQYFVEQGFTVDIVTPGGGKAALYHVGELAAELDAIEKSPIFRKKTSETLTPYEIDANRYVAVFYPGGHGQYFDVIGDERIAAITASVYERGGIIGTAGHGAASLVDIRLNNCRYLVEGKRMTCFPYWAELKWMNISNYGKLLAFDMEKILRRRGAELVVATPETASDTALTLVVDADNRIVTGSFASSAQWVAEQMVTLINSSN